MLVDPIVCKPVKARREDQEADASMQAIVHVVLLIVDCTVEKRDAAAKLRLPLSPTLSRLLLCYSPDGVGFLVSLGTGLIRPAPNSKPYQD